MKSRVLIQAIEEAGYQARSYSGRGMYGKSCVGVTCGWAEAFTLGVKVGAVLASEDSAEALADLWVRTDSMGHDMIVYFPGVAWDEDEDEDEDEVAA